MYIKCNLIHSYIIFRNLRLRNDVVTDGYCYQDILRNAIVKEENYFVAPPGNIPLDSDTSKNTIF